LSEHIEAMSGNVADFLVIVAVLSKSLPFRAGCERLAAA
jgi:hypothetical protein